MARTLSEIVGRPDFLATRKAYYGAYTICFCALALACFSGLYAYGHGLIWDSDGVDQHFSFFCYFGTWVRQAVSEGVLPQWDFSLGYGADIICSLASWIGDPFNVFSIFCPEQYSEYLYQALVVVRLYLVGFSFSAFSRYHERDGFSTLLGALAYAFCGYCLMKGAFRHAMFINPAIFLPWVLLGADKVLDGRRPTTLVVALAVTFISYFYFAYMIVIFLVLYCLLRYFVGGRGTHGKRTAKGFFVLVGRFALYVLTGAFMAGVLLLPIVMYVLQMDRISAEHGSAIVRSLQTYLYFPLAFAGGSTNEAGLPMEALAVFGVSMLFTASCFKREPEGSAGAAPSGQGNPPLLEIKQAKIALALLLVFALIPFFGRVFNGFSYRTDRWMFALAMCASYTIVLVTPYIRNLQKRDWVAIGVVFALFVADAAFLLASQGSVVESGGQDIRPWMAVAIVCLVGTYALIFLAWKRAGTAGMRTVLAVLLFANVAQFANFALFAHEDADDAETLADYMVPLGGAISQQTTDSPTSLFLDLDRESQPYRFDKATELHRRNSTAMQPGDIYSVDFYASIYSQVIDDFRDDLAIAQNTAMTSHLVYTNNSRAVIEAVSAVKYFLMKANEKSARPYGFDTLAAQETVDGADYEIWKTDHALPLAFTYDKVISTGEFESADPMRRQEGLLQACAVDGSSLPSADVEDSAREVAFSVNEQESDGARLEPGGSIVCTKENATLVLDVEGLANSETYVYLGGMDFTRYLPDGTTAGDDGEAMGVVEQVKLALKDFGTDTPDFFITFKNGKTVTKTRYATSYGRFNTGRDTWMVNTGYKKKACTKLTLTFSEPGTALLDDMKVLCEPMDDLAERVTERAADPVSVELGTNAINGSVDAPGKRLVYCSVPYSDGWSATVDGQPVEVMKANVGFMAIEVEAGHHEFAFTYESPYLKAGLALSIAGIALLVVMNVAARSGSGARRKEPRA